MSTTKKWMLVLLSVCFLFSLAFGITIAGHAEGETEIEWPDIITTSDWSGNTELRIPSNLKNLNNQQLTYDNSMLGKVKITRGETTFACSHIYEWGGELTFYFNGSNYTGKTPTAGDKRRCRPDRHEQGRYHVRQLRGDQLDVRRYRLGAGRLGSHRNGDAAPRRAVRLRLEQRYGDPHPFQPQKPEQQAAHLR